MEMNCQGLSIRKSYPRCMCHPGIPNRCRPAPAVCLLLIVIMLTPQGWLRAQIKTRPRNAPHFWSSSVTLQREAGSAAPDLPRRQQECLHTPSRPLLSLQSSLTDPMTSSGPQCLTRARWATLTAVQAHCWLQLDSDPPPFYTLFFFFSSFYVSFLSLPCTRL